MVIEREKLPLAISFIFAIFLIACNEPSGAKGVSQTDDSDSIQVVVIGDNTGYPEGCSPHEVATLILQFFEAYNEGDQEQLASFFPPTFQWYSDTRVEVVNGNNEQIHFVTRPGSREELLRYFSERHEQNEQLKLQLLSVASPHGGAGHVNIVFVYRRQADDVQPGPDGVTRVGEGKGVIACRNQKIFVWSMGTAAPDEDEEWYQRPCTEPAGELSAMVCIEEEM